MIPELSVILLASMEGRLVHPTFTSALTAIAHARKAGIVVEFLVMLDRPTKATRLYFDARQAAVDRIFECDFGDPGLARNAAIHAAKGTYISLLDGDDLWGQAWLTKSVEFLRQQNTAVICHPAISRFFGERTDIVAHPDQTDPRFSIPNLLVENAWTVLVTAPKRVFLDVPFPATSLQDGIGYEDWAWQCNCIGAGYIHRVVPDTIHFVRAKRNSHRAQTKLFGCIMVPGSEFCAMVRQALREEVSSTR
ncbi:MAG: glycosyltransferase family A protein [Bdellovibrionota bacterium]